MIRKKNKFDIVITFPSRINDCSYGKCLIATEDLSKGTIVQQFKGPIISKNQISEQDINYVILIDDHNWLIPLTNARYLNHSCTPNCYVDDELRVITKSSVKKGEELTIIYNIVRKGENPGKWDKRWTFECKCGASNCQGLVNHYIYQDDSK